MGSGNLNGTLSGSHRRIDGYRDHSQWESTTGFGSLSADPSESLKLRGHLLLQRGDQEIPGPLPAPDWKDDPKRSDTPLDHRDTKAVQGAVTATLSASPTTELTASFAGDGRNVDAVETIIPIGTLDRSSKSRTVQGEVRAHWKPTSGWLPHLMIGGDLRSGTLESRYHDPSSGGATVGAGDVRRLSGGVFALAEVRPDERWTLTGGVRGDWLRSSLDDPTDAAPRGPDDDLRAFSPTLGVSYALPRGNAYVSYAGSFKAPTLEQLYDQRPYTVDIDGPGGTPPFTLRLSNHAIEPQRGNHVEAGARSQLASGVWGDATVYYAKSKDEIGFDLASFNYSNIDKSIHYGFEGQLVVTAAERWSGTVSYAWTIAQFDGGAHDGKQINTVPEHQLFVRAGYDHPFGGSVTAEVSYVRDQWIDEDNVYELDPYAVVNLGLTQKVGSAEVFASVRNVFDERYATLGYVTIDQVGNDLPLYYPAQDRSFAAGLRVKLAPAAP